MDLDSDTPSESSDDNEYDSCTNYFCKYGGKRLVKRRDNQNRDELLWCEKCVSLSRVVCMCSECMTTGAHAHHHNHLKLKKEYRIMF